MYRQFISQAERDRIVNEYSDRDTPPHCNDRMFHRSGICAFCDGYYKANGVAGDSLAALPRGAFFVEPEANGWGGNQAPTVDDIGAAEEDAIWDRALSGLA